jgi:AAHS family benzoate transporter-like MFS transporter
MLGGVLIGAGFALDAIFYVLAALGLLGALLTMMVPLARGHPELDTTRIAPAQKTTTGEAAAASRQA